VRRIAELERRVAERTAELEVAVSNLHAQMSQRAAAEARLRESEERYRRLVEHSPEAVLVVARGKVLFANAAGVRLFGARDLAELLATPPLKLVHTSERAQAATQLAERLAGEGENVSPRIEVRLARLDGTSIDAEITSASVNFDGQPAAQLLIRDVGERRAVERMKDELLSIVSHELRTPLTSLRGSLGLLAGGMLGRMPHQGQRMLEIAVSNADRLIRLLNDVLDLERLRAGQMTMQLEAHMAADLVQRAVCEMRGLAERTGVRLSLGRLEGIVCADSDRLVQVLTNLVSNAIKFSPADCEVRVEARLDGRHVRFSVADHGRGIPGDHLETIFERFRQVDASDSRIKGGTGLGLAICRSIVHQHEGRLWAESTLGQGSTFYVELRAAA
jgi:PAS domain S-box-containing protein